MSIQTDDGGAQEREPVLYVSRCGYCGSAEGTVDANEVCSGSTPDEMHPHRFGVFEVAPAPSEPGEELESVIEGWWDSESCGDLTELAKRIRVCAALAPKTGPITEKQNKALTQGEFPARGQQFDCPECGERVRVDEDGCCSGCGRDAIVSAAPPSAEPGAAREVLETIRDSTTDEGAVLRIMACDFLASQPTVQGEQEV